MATSRRSMFGLVVLILGISVASTWWTNRQQATIGEQLAAVAGPGDLRMLSSDTCGICVAARGWFQRHGVAFSECSIEREPACAAEFQALRAPGTPVFVVRGQVQIGFDPARLLQPLLQ